jgi:DNA-binding HxlR family transcriptional regulator
MDGHPGTDTSNLAAGLPSPRQGRSALAGRHEEATDRQMIDGTRTALDLVAGKWSVDVLYLLASGTRRYSEIFYEVGEISKKTLTQTLRALERDGLIERRVHAEVPPKVEYSLTALGWSITGPLMTMYEWAAEHLPELGAVSLDGSSDRRRPLAAAA